MRNVVHAPVVGADFFGRADDVQFLWQQAEAGGHVLLLGNRGTGRTSLMRQIWAEPRPMVDVVFADLSEAAAMPAAMAALATAFFSHPRYHAWTRALPFHRRARAVIDRTPPGRIDPAGLETGLMDAAEGRWEAMAERLHSGLRQLPDPERRLIIVLDDAGSLVARGLKNPSTTRPAQRFGAWLAALRDDPALAGRVTLFAVASHGQAEAIRVLGATATRGVAAGQSRNAPAAYHITPWSQQQAVRLLLELAEGSNMALELTQAGLMLDLLGEAIPRHVQALFRAVRTGLKADPGWIEPVIERAYGYISGPGGEYWLSPHAAHLDNCLPEAERGLARFTLARLSRSASGMTLSELMPQAYGSERFPTVVWFLEEEGYIRRDGTRLRFRSNLLRDWWMATQLRRR